MSSATRKMPQPSVIQAQDLGFSIKGKTIVHAVSMSVQCGELLGLIGRNGSGKSTLLRLLAGVISPSKGCVRLNDHPLQRLNRRAIAQVLAFVSQNAETADAITVQDAVELGRTPWLSALQPNSAHDQKVVANALMATGMTHKAASLWQALSGGERQRVHIARALAQEPKVLLLDEPNNHLDIHQQLSLMQLIQSLPITKVIALHDLNQALQCNRLAVMDEGQLIACGTPSEVLTPSLLEQVFQVRMRELVDPVDGTRVLRFTPQI